MPKSALKTCEEISKEIRAREYLRIGGRELDKIIGYRAGINPQTIKFYKKALVEHGFLKILGIDLYEVPEVVFNANLPSA